MTLPSHLHRRERRIGGAAAVIASALTLSCAVGPDYQRPTLDVPEKFAGAEAPAPDHAGVAPEWWKLFGEPELDELEKAALAANLDLQAAAARVVEARAAARVAGSQYYPVITFDPSVNRSRVATTSPTGAGRTGSATVTNVKIPFDLSYEVDVWGRVRRADEAAVATAQASADDFDVVLLTLTADVAQGYFNLRSLDAQAEILGRSIELYRRQVELTTTQKRVGLVGQTDVLQAETQLDATTALEVEVRRQRADAEHALAILTGRPPGEVTLAVRGLELEPPAIPVGLPPDLLRQRPDIAKAEHDLVAANAAIGVAQADLYPQLTLTGSAGFQNLDAGKVIDWPLRFWSIGAGLTAPIFEGGRLTAELEQAKARRQEVEAIFRSVVLTAIGDVETALTDLHLRSDAGTAQARAVVSARNYLRLAELQYRQGVIGYLQVIDADRTLLSNELLLAQILDQRFAATVLLIKALGGGWSPELASSRAEPAAASAPAAAQ